jgi:hypothetical protein
MSKCFVICTVFAVLVPAAACTKSSAPAKPSSVADAEEAPSSMTDAKTGVTLTTPVPVSPAQNAEIKFAEQPITLTVRNAASSGSSAPTYTFQVASDAGFGSVVQTKDGIAQGAGQTSVALDKLVGDRVYYWRARSNAAGVSGYFSTVRAFRLGPEVVLQAPVLVAPADGGTMSGQAPLIVNNVARSGPAGQLSYRFEVADSPSFTNLVFTATVNEGPNQTSATMTAQLTTNQTYYWRVRASDPSNAVTGPYSNVASFRYVPFDMSQAVIVNSPPDLASWPETAKITSITIQGDSFPVEFDRRDGPGRWPDVVPAGWSGALQYTLGMCVNPRGNQWYCSAVVQFWYGRTLTDSGNPSRVGIEWFYDPVRWGPIHYYQPSDGELVGIFVGAGNLRDGGNVTRASCPRVCERSNVALIPWSTGGGVSYTFANGLRTLTVHR